MAARQLNLPQGAIGQQIRRLEELSENALFQRADRRMDLTAEGEQVIGPTCNLVAANYSFLAALSETRTSVVVLTASVFSMG